MSNHGEDMTPEQRRHFEKFFSEQKKEMKLGPTGKFPEGKIHPTDKGEIQLAIGHKNGKVFLSFGVPTDWVAFEKSQAIQLSETLINHANQL